MSLIARAAAAFAVVALSAPASAATFNIDPVHSAVVFNVGHLNVSKVWGRFNDFSGTISVDDATGALTGVNVTVKTNTVDTAVARRDTHLKSADFFNVTQFPTMTFVSTSVAAVEANRYELTGEFTLKGVTKTVQLEVVQLGRARDANGERLGAEGTFTIKRSEFGMTYGLPTQVGDDVAITVAFEANKAP